MSTASGTRAVARPTTALSTAGRRFDDLADPRRLAHQRLHPRPAERREPGERRRPDRCSGRRSSPGWRRLPAPDSRPGQDAAASGARRRRPERSAPATRRAPDRGRTGRCAARRRGRSRPGAAAGVRPMTPNSDFRYASSPCWRASALGRALGREPVGVVGAKRHVPAFASRAQRLAREIGIDRDAGDSAPRGVSDIPVVQRAVEMAGDHRVRAVGADYGGRISRRRVRQRDANTVGSQPRFRGRSPLCAGCRSQARLRAHR